MTTAGRPTQLHLPQLRILTAPSPLDPIAIHRVELDPQPVSATEARMPRVVIGGGDVSE